MSNLIDFLEKSRGARTALKAFLFTVILNSFQNPQIIENGNGKWKMGNGRAWLSASRRTTSHFLTCGIYCDIY